MWGRLTFHDARHHVLRTSADASTVAYPTSPLARITRNLYDRRNERSWHRFENKILFMNSIIIIVLFLRIP